MTEADTIRAIERRGYERGVREILATASTAADLTARQATKSDRETAFVEAMNALVVIGESLLSNNEEDAR